METFKDRPVSFAKRELSQCVLVLEDLLTQETPQLYIAWLHLSPYKRTMLRRAMARTIQCHVFNNAFWKAIADTVIDENVQVNTPLYQYLRKVLFRGNGRALLTFLEGRRNG